MVRVRATGPALQRRTLPGRRRRTGHYHYWPRNLATWPHPNGYYMYTYEPSLPFVHFHGASLGDCLRALPLLRTCTLRSQLNFSRPPALSEVGFMKLTAAATKLCVLFVTGGINRDSKWTRGSLTVGPVNVID